jgi:hypothetical protein
MIAKAFLKIAASTALLAAGLSASFAEDVKTVVKIGYLPIT